jgi:hypothetical protein
MDSRQDRMDGNIAGLGRDVTDLRRDVADLKQGLRAIMRHLGVDEPGES